MTAFNLNRYLSDNANLREGWPEHMLLDGFRQVRPITCADGLSLSVQASTTHYCEPRDGVGPWTAVEVGFPSHRVEELMEYDQHDAEPTKTVYGWVPVEVVERIVEAHGGIISPRPV
jgi:hypothetical protein